MDLRHCLNSAVEFGHFVEEKLLFFALRGALDRLSLCVAHEC